MPDSPFTDAHGRTTANITDAIDAGFLGVEVDPTDSANYSVAGVTSGAPVPSIHPGKPAGS